MKSVNPLLLMAGVAMLAAACGGQPPLKTAATPSPTQTASSGTVPPVEVPVTPVPSADPVAVEWDGGRITLSQIDNILGPRMAQIIEYASGTARLEEILAAERRKTLDVLLENYLLIQEANARHLSVTPARQDELVRGFRGRYETAEEYENALRQAGQSEAGLTQILSNIELGRLCIEDEQKKIKESITPEAMREFYDQHTEEYCTQPGYSKVNWVVIQAGEKRTLEEAESVARRLHAEVKEKLAGLIGDVTAQRKVLQEYAKEYSDDFSGKYNYGYLFLYHKDPWWSQYTQAFRDQVMKCEVGDLSEVVPVLENRFGFFLVFEKALSVVQPFESEPIQSILPNLMLKLRMDDWRENLKKKYNVKLDEAVLKRPRSVPSTPLQP
ncbi:MAG TPA: peptidylprolyl isomerase [bacterium]|nr:peptidylprolyl isomerase [bacterium]HOL94413.1 peptidylprolyl isomerase [bacterium]HPO99514.1 peptidylprolyl isomerase [bacterium]HXK94202.1 peptidylprolyl isomerase [bacterium]